MIFVMDLLSYYGTIVFLACTFLFLMGCWGKISGWIHRFPSKIMDGILGLIDGLYHWKIHLIVLLSIAIAANLVSNAAVREWVGIHNLQLEKDGTYCYYITAEQGNKSYTMPAKIEIVTDTHYYERGDGRTESDTVRHYFVTEAYWTNGSVLYFEDDNNNIYVGKSTGFTDTDGGEWSCALLNQHAYSAQVEETSHTTWSTVLSLCFRLVSIVSVLLAVIRLKNPWRNYDISNSPPAS